MKAGLIGLGAMVAAGDFSLPLTEQTLVDYERLMAQGFGDEDISALYRLKRPERS